MVLPQPPPLIVSLMDERHDLDAGRLGLEHEMVPIVLHGQVVDVAHQFKKLQLTNKAGHAGKKDKRLYPVEAIHGCYFGGRKGQPTKYLVEWSGYGLDQCSWESLTNLRHVRWSIQQFQRKYGYGA